MRRWPSCRRSPSRAGSVRTRTSSTAADLAMQITLVRGDITEQDVDAVVNAANSGLMGGGGVDGAILRAGCQQQLDARRQLRDRLGQLPTGQAAATDAGDMPARWVIHVVGPVWRANEDRSHLLASCYREALQVADELGARTVAFPAVSAASTAGPSRPPPTSPSMPCEPPRRKSRKCGSCC